VTSRNHERPADRGSPNVALIRFYAELNDFLPRERRQRDIVHEFVVAPSVKDVIEAFGVPHTEVDLVLVDGEPVNFSHRLADGDRISVYPVFEAFDVASVNRSLRPTPLRDPRFVADVHLGTLARYLRLVGFDTRFDPDWDDEALAAISVEERRVLLTRDRGLLKRRVVTHGIFVRDDQPREQVVDVVRRLHLADRLRPFTRCMACNGALEAVDKEEIADRLEPRTRRDFNRFRRCPDCGRLYWEGSHHARLAALVEHVRERGA
jgi:uncharacterized protein with PIN domain